MDAKNLQWTIGPVRITRVEERTVPIRWENLVPNGAQLLDECRPWIDPFVSSSGSHLLLSIHSFVVKTPDTLIVVDTCIGDSDDFQLPGDGAFGDRLANSLPGGFDAVNVVVCTHLHFDHIGWNTATVDGTTVPRFKNARYLVSEAELAADRDEEDKIAYARSIEPIAIAGQLDAVSSNHQIDRWVSLEPSAGHTPGHVSLRVTDGDNVGLITGDFIHTPLQFAHPSAYSNPDFDRSLATATRESYIAELVDSEVLVLGTHFSPPTAGLLSRHGGGVQFG